VGSAAVSDWLDELEPADRDQWEAFVAHARREALEKIADSAFVVQLVAEEPDVKVAVELGFAILLDKPLLAVVMPHSRPSAKLLAIADEVVEADVDTEAGRAKVAAAIDRLMSEVGE
jgi:nucleoside 2-deoxyribosyltransferase